MVGGVAGLMVFLASSFIYGYQSTKIELRERISEADEAVAAANASLPQMIDDDLRADRLAYDDDSVNLYMTLINYDAAEIDVDAVRDKYKQYYISVACETEPLSESLSQGTVFTYYLADRNSIPSVEFTVTQSDCL